MPPAGGRHGNVAIQIGGMLNAYIKANQLGPVFAAETGFILRRNPDTVRAPDASFVAKERLPTGELPIGFMDMAPDLAVEVVSWAIQPGKCGRRWRTGSKQGLVWCGLYPAARSATAYQSLNDFQELSEGDSLDSSQVVLGFTCRIRDLFY
jgi:Uma2 family endonuclease